MYVRWRWTVSLHGILNFLEQRLENDAQYEIREYAEAVKELTKQSFPQTYSTAFGE
jgi:thymidylate synthase (FAD)